MSGLFSTSVRNHYGNLGKNDATGFNEPIRFEQAPMTVTLMLLGQLQSFKKAVLSHNTCIVLFCNIYS